MDKFMVACIARKQFRVIARGGLCRFSMLFTCLVVFGWQLFFQGDYFESSLTGLSTMGSFIPYENQYLYVIISVFLLFLLVGAFWRAECKLDSTVAIYSRAESNGELLGGYFLAFIGVALLGAFVVCGVGIFVHVFFSLAPFTFLPYLFYVFTLTLPALVFYTGLTFLVLVVVREQFLALMILSGVWVLNLCCADRVAGGGLDPLGIYLSNAFSNMTGHPDLLPYLVQRVGWFLVGMGCFGVAVRLFGRLPNCPGMRLFSPVIFIVAGSACIFSFYMNHVRDFNVREIYRDTYARYAGKGCLTLEKCDVNLRFEGDKINCGSRLILRNETGENLDEVLFYLNPSLEVLSVKERGKEIPVTRDHQVVRLEREVGTGERLEITVVYAGGIDERVCYLDVPDEHQREKQFLTCRFGKHNVFLDKNYALLLPECLWYPVVNPMVNPEIPNDVVFPFADYTLTVSGVGGKKVISQGKRGKTGEGIKFEPEYPLQGVSLCMGDYVPFNVTVDSVQYGIYVFRENVGVLKGLPRVNMKVLIRELKHLLEERLLCDYPYNRLIMIEAPLAFSSYYRKQRGGCEYVQPEMLFVPERGVGYWKDARWQKRQRIDFERNIALASQQDEESVEDLMPSGVSPGKLENSIVKNFLTHFLFEKYEVAGGGVSDVGFQLWQPDWKRLEFVEREYSLNQYSLFPMLRERLHSVVGQQQGMISSVFNHVMKIETEHLWRVGGDEGYFDREAISYLKNHSLEEALNDVSLPANVRERILALKVDELFQLFTARGIQPPRLFRYIDSTFRQSIFQSIDAGGLKRDFVARFGVDWDSVLSEWRKRKELPAYLLKSFCVTKIDNNRAKGVGQKNVSWDDLYSNMSPVNIRYWVSIEVYNDSDVDGCVVLKDNGVGYGKYSGDCHYELVPLKAKEGKIVRWEYEGFAPYLDLGLCCNEPREFRGGNEKLAGLKDTVCRAERAYFTGEGNPYEIVVDNESADFYVKERRSWRLQDFFGRKDKVSEDMFVYPDEQFWKKAIQCQDDRGNNLFGTPVASAMYKLAGKGDLSASWKAEIMEEGEYEIFVYVKHLPAGGNRKEIERSQSAKRDLPNRQYYTVRNGEDEYQAETDTRDYFRQIWKPDNWFSLGKFALKPGTVEVSLWDKGDEVDQVIVADAVKFVFVEK